MVSASAISQPNWKVSPVSGQEAQVHSQAFALKGSNATVMPTAKVLIVIC